MAGPVNGRVVPVLTAESADDAQRACEALLAGGMASVEITLRTKAAVEAIRRASRIDGLLVGAGTVLTKAQLASAVDAGARFAVAPSMNGSVVHAAQASRSCPERRRRPRSTELGLSAAESSSFSRPRFSAVRRS